MVQPFLEIRNIDLRNRNTRIREKCFWGQNMPENMPEKIHKYTQIKDYLSNKYINLIIDKTIHVFKYKKD